MQKSTFVFDSYTIDLPGQLLTFVYKIQGEEQSYTFTEKIHLPLPVETVLPKELLEKVVSRLHLMLGISYWKLFASYHIQINSTHLTEDEAHFFSTVYTKGLGEFFYKNNIDFHNLIRFPSAAVEKNPVSYEHKDRSLVGLGGGKDSLTTIELLKKNKKEFTGYILKSGNNHTIAKETAEIAQIDSLIVTRDLDPQLYELNTGGQVFNGHIPISTIYAFVGILLGILYDYRYVIVSNEYSASYGNVEYLGQEINHQWSKSVEFEKMFQEYIHEYITPDITYFSLLRPYYEIAVVKEFIKYPQYFSHFSSCNRNFAFRLDQNTDKKWCGECPKCAFVFLLLSAFISKDQLIRMFGQNLFIKESLIRVYKELLAIDGVKPFECVGTPDETTVAFAMTYAKGEYNDDVVMKMFVTDVLPLVNTMNDLQNEVFIKHESNLIPEVFKTL